MTFGEASRARLVFPFAMKRFLITCCLATSTLALAQPQRPNPFAAFTDAPVASQLQTVSLAQLAKREQPALLSLQQPLNGAKQVMAVAWGREGVLLAVDNAWLFKPMSEVAALYDGTALLPAAPAPALQIADAVQVVPITQLGDNAQVTARYTLTNTGQAPLDVAVASTSCGCTAATLDTARIEPGQSAQLTAAMHASDERLVRVTLQNNDPAMPRPVVALQSKRTFAPFQVPAPLSLYGEKGQVIRAQTEFELPVGWQVARVVAAPAWLQTQLKPAPAPPQNGALPRFELAVTAPDSAPEGTLQGQVMLELQGAPVKSLSVPVGGFVSNDVTATPRLISLQNSPQGLARRIVVIHGPRPFSIRAIRSGMKGFEARYEPTIEAKAHAIEILVPVAGTLGEAFFERDTVELSDGRELALDIMGSVGAGTLRNLAQNVKLNAPAPAFVGTDTQGKKISLASLRGHNVVLTFFPHCFTGGCESHLASLRDTYAALQGSGAQVVAISTDDAPTVAAFARELRLPFPTLSDPKRQIALAYGAVQNATEAPSRLTILIDKTGVVRWIDTDVRVQTHGADVLSKIRELGLGAQLK